MKVAIVSGASGNLGRAVVYKFLDAGYKVIGTVIPNDPVEIDFPTESFEKVVVDLLQENDCRDFVASVVGKFKRVDVAVLTVGGFAMGNIANTKSSDISKQYKLNFETTYNLAQPLFLQMLHQDAGRIFMLGSKPGLDSKNANGMIAYGLGKSLVFRLAELMNHEARGMNVVTTVIVPGTIDTPQNRQSMPNSPFSDWVKPEQIAELILYYSGEAASILRDPVIKAYNKA